MLRFKACVRVALLTFSLALSLTFSAAATECGGSCCITAGTVSIGDDLGFVITPQYDWMTMKTLLAGTQTVSPQQVVSQALASGATRFSVPTKMVMQRITLQTSWRFHPKQSVMLNIPYVINNMDMYSASRAMSMMGGMTMGTRSAMPMAMNMTMKPAAGLGDISALYVYDVHRDDSARVWVSGGLQIPTGCDRLRTESGTLVHMMMQPGTGALDFIVNAGARVNVKKYTVIPSLTYQLNGRNSFGYACGNRLNLDLSNRYQLAKPFDLKLDFNYVATAKDSTNGFVDSKTGLVAYQNPSVSMIDNVQNTGLSALYVSPGFQWSAGRDVTVSGEYRIPVMQAVNGTQQVVDSWFMVRASVRF